MPQTRHTMNPTKSQIARYNRATRKLSKALEEFRMAAGTNLGRALKSVTYSVIPYNEGRRVETHLRIRHFKSNP